MLHEQGIPSAHSSAQRLPQTHRALNVPENSQGSDFKIDLGLVSSPLRHRLDSPPFDSLLRRTNSPELVVSPSRSTH